MSTKAQAILEEFKKLAPDEQLLVRDQVVSLTEARQQVNHLLSAQVTQPMTDAEFEAALDELTGCTAGRNTTARLLADRARDRDEEQAKRQRRQRERRHV